MFNQERHLLANAAETYGVPLPDYLVEAQELLTAATAYKTEVAGLEEPTLENVTTTTIAETIDAVLAFSQRPERLRLAARVEIMAETAVDAAWSRFKHILLTELADPFDEAASVFMAANDLYQRHDPKAVATLTDLVGVRDLLHEGSIGQGLPSVNLDLPTRIATFACRHDIVNRVKIRTAGMQRGTQPWLEALLSIPGCRLKWQTPAQQRAHVDAIPAGGDSILAHSGGDAA